jgi:hypothetical protein
MLALGVTVGSTVRLEGAMRGKGWHAGIDEGACRHGCDILISSVYG